jgi:uncharacterized membrane protein YfcA
MRLAALAAASFVAAVIGAITGGNSLLTVPVMLFVGMDPRIAVGTNMVSVVALTGSAWARFARERVVPRHPTWGLTLTAIPGSVLGAYVAANISQHVLRTIISVAMLAMAIFIAVQPQFGAERHTRSRGVQIIGYVAMAVWAVYGGLFSGGYTTVLTFCCVAIFGTTLVEAVGLTKIVNLVGSVAACVVFVAERRVDWTIAAVMSAAALVGGWLGAHLAIRSGTVWVRRIFVLMVAGLGVKLLFDVLH